MIPILSKRKPIVLPKPEELHSVPSIKEQAAKQGWRAGIFNFGKARIQGVDYFNCSIVQRPDARWLVARRSRFNLNDKMGMNDLMAFQLHDDLTPLFGKKIELEKRYEMEHFEDPRAVIVNGRVFVSCCNFVRNRKGCHYPHQMISEVDSEWKSVKRYDPKYGNNGDDTWANTKHEKNWLFFHDGADWRMIYRASPHHIVRFDDQFKVLHEIKTNWVYTIWSYGEIRGGTPPVLARGEYWTFFHSSTPWQHTKRQYHTGAYAFEAQPPYRITKITRKPLLSGSRFDRWGDTKPLVTFAGGSLFDGKRWLVVGGSNDLDCFWCEIPHRDLERLTVEIE